MTHLRTSPVTANERQIVPADPCPPLRPSVDLAPVDHGGQRMFCLYDRNDSEAGQVVVSESALDLLTLLDGTRNASAVRAAFALRTGQSITDRQVLDFVGRLDEALLLRSERYRKRQRQRLADFRALPVRPAAHAGRAYPGEPEPLRAFLDGRYTARGGPGSRPGSVNGPSPSALIAPHIDLLRGGHSYAWGYRELAERTPADLYLLLGTCHMPMKRPFAATSKDYDTPLGVAPTDTAFLDRLARRAPFDIYRDEFMHRDEHSLEFQAVYLRYLGLVGEGAAALVPVLCVPPYDLADGQVPRESPMVGEMLHALRETIAEDGRRVCLVAGADFAHVGPQFRDPAPVDAFFAGHVRIGDLEMLDRVADGDADGFFRQVVDEPPAYWMAGEAGAVGGARRICGLAPIYALLWLLGPSQGRVVHYDQWIAPDGSGSVTFGCVVFP